MNLSKADKLQRLRDVKAYIADHKLKNKAYPKIKEISNAIGISENTAIRYKKLIIDQDRAELNTYFAESIVVETEELLVNIDKNKLLYISIIEDCPDESLRIMAAKTLIETQIDKLHLMRDGPDYLFGNSNTTTTATAAVNTHNNINMPSISGNNNNDNRPNQTSKEQVHGTEDSNSSAAETTEEGFRDTFSSSK